MDTLTFKKTNVKNTIAACNSSTRNTMQEIQRLKEITKWNESLLKIQQINMKINTREASIHLNVKYLKRNSENLIHKLKRKEAIARDWRYTPNCDILSTINIALHLVKYIEYLAITML